MSIILVHDKRQQLSSQGLKNNVFHGLRLIFS